MIYTHNNYSYASEYKCILLWSYHCDCPFPNVVVPLLFLSALDLPRMIEDPRCHYPPRLLRLLFLIFLIFLLLFLFFRR
jgi:hypothetical protein